MARPSSWLGPKFLIAFTLSLSLTSLHVSTAPAEDSAGTPEVLKYVPGKTYQYTFASKAVTELVGTSDEQSTVELTAQAHLAVTPTDFVLTLKNVKLQAPSKQDVPLASLEGSSIRFSYSNGRIKKFKRIETEAKWATNIKRAVASMLVNYAVVDSEIPRVQYYESDASGHKCPTDYVISANGQFKKTRNLNLCDKRDGGFSTQFGVPFKLPNKVEGIQSDTTLDSSQSCDQVFENGILKSATCSETHRATLFNNGDSGARASVSASLKLETVQDGTPTATASTANTPCTLHFKFPGSGVGKNRETALAAARELATKLCGDIQNGVLGEDTAETFRRLKNTVKFLGAQDLEALYGGLGSAQCRKLFTDAVAIAGTSGSISFMSGLLKSGKIPNYSTKRRFRLYTTFADKPNEEALKSFKDLIGGSVQDLDPKFLLTASGLARQFCLTTRKKPDCGTNPAYVSLVEEIAKKAQDNCAASDEQVRQKSIFALQALGNLDSLPPKAVAAITSCLGSNFKRIQVHALQGFRRDPCQSTLKAGARKILENKDLPSDLRIQAYLAFSQCYQPVDSRILANLIRNEDTLQVLAFIKSHRENQYSSRDGNEEQIEAETELFSPSNNPLLSKPLSDPRKFSHNFQFHHLDDEVSFTGCKSEVNLIYAPDAFLPKTASANFSLDLYGESYNLFEVGVNLDGVDRVFEKLFGPNGDYPSTFDEKRTRSRGKRAADAPSIKPTDIEYIQNQVTPHTLPPSEGSDIFLRILGTTVFARNFDIAETLFPSNADDSPGGIESFIVNAVKGVDLDFTEPLPVYGDELIVPTVSGLPLTIRAEAVAIFSLQTTNKLAEDMSEYKPRLAPSASLESKLKMTFGSDVFEAGFLVNTKAHTALDLSAVGLIKPSNGFSYDLTLTLPQAKVNLVHLTNDLYWTEQRENQASPTKTALNPKNAQEVIADNKCCDKTPRLLNLNLCSTIKVPGGKGLPQFPLSGPLTASFVLSKVEPTKPYEINIQVHVDKETPSLGPSTLELLFDIPGSSVNRKAEIKGRLELTRDAAKEKHNFQLSLDSPSTKLAFLYDHNFDFKTGVGSEVIKVGVSGREFGIQTQRTYLVEGDKETRDLSLLIISPGSPPVEVLSIKAPKNTVQGADGKTVTKSVDLKVYGSLKPSPPVLFTFSGTAVKPYSAAGVRQGINLKDVQLTCRDTRTFLLNLNQNQKALDLDLKFNYKGKEEDIKVNGALDFPSQSGWTLKGTVSSSLSDLVNAQLDVETSSRLGQDSKKSATLKLRNGGVISYTYLWEDKGNKKETSRTFDVQLPSRGLNGNLKTNLRVEGDKYHFDYDLTTGSNIASKADFNFQRSDVIYDVTVHVVVPGRTIDFSGARTKSSAAGQPSLTYKHSLNVQPGLSFGVETKVFEEVIGADKWKKRVTTITSDQLPNKQDVTLTIKYDLDAQKRVKISSGSGTLDVDVASGQASLGRMRIANKIPATFKEDLAINFELLAGNAVHAKVNLNTAPTKKDLADFSGSVRLISVGTKYALHAGVDTNKFSEPQNKAGEFSFDFKVGLDRGTDNCMFEACGGKPQSFDLEGGAGVNLDAKFNRGIVGDHSVTLKITTAKRESYKFLVDANIENDKKTKFGTFQVSFDIPSKKDDLRVELGIRNLDTATKDFNIIARFSLSTKGTLPPPGPTGITQDTLEILFNSETKDGARVLELIGSDGGAVLTSPAKYSIGLVIGTQNYGLKFSGGDQNENKLFSINVKKEAGPPKKYTVAILGEARSPAGVKNLGDATLTVSYRYNSLTDFDFNEALNFQLSVPVGKEAKGTLVRKISVGPNIFDFFSEVNIARGGGELTKEHYLKIKLERDEKKITGAFDIHDKKLGALFKNPAKSDATLNFELGRDPSNLRLSVDGKFPNHAYEVFSLKVDRLVVGAVRNMTVDGKLDEQQIHATSSVENSPNRKALDFSLAFDDSPPRKLTLVYEDPAGKGPSVEALYQWGDSGQVVSSKGTLVKSDAGWDASFDFDSPPPANKWKVTVSRKAEALKRSFSLNAESPETQQIINIGYDKQEKSGRFSWKGNGKLKLNLKTRKVNVGGGVQILYDTKFYDETRTKNGQRLKTNIKFAFDKISGNFSLQGGTSGGEKRLDLHLCTMACIDFTSLLRTENLKQSYQASVGSDGFGGGFVLDIDTSADSKTRTRSLKVTTTKEGKEQEVGLKVFRTPGKESDLTLSASYIKGTPTSVSKRGLEVTLTEGTVYSAGITRASWEAEGDGEAVEVLVSSRAGEAPPVKLTLAGSKSRASTNEEGQGQDFHVGLRHSGIPRDLGASLNYRYGITSKVFEGQVAFDIFKAEADKVVVSAELNHNVEASAFQLVVSAKSDGQGLSLESNCKNIKIEDSALHANCDFSSSVGGKEKKFTLNYDNTKAKKTIEVVGKTQRYFFYNRTLTFTCDEAGPDLCSPDVNIELQLPLMTDTRLIQLKSTEGACGASLRTNPSSASPEEYSEAWYALTPSTFGLGLSRNSGGGKKTLVDVEVTNVKKQLVLRLDWERENIKQYLNFGLSRVGNTQQKLVEFSNQAFDEFQETADGICSSFSNSYQDIQPLARSIAKVINLLTGPYSSRLTGPIQLSSSRRALFLTLKRVVADGLSAGNQAAQGLGNSLSGFLDTLARLESIPKPAYTANAVSKVNGALAAASQALSQLSQAAKPYKEKYPVLQKAATKLREKVVDKVKTAYEATREDINELLPYPEVKEFLENGIEYFEAALLKPEEATPEKKDAVTRKFKNAAAQVIKQTFSADFQKGHIEAKIPRFSKAYRIRNFIKPEVEHDPYEEFIEKLFANPKEVLMPVDATALVLSDSHFITFDGKLDRFEKTCQYLLTSDFTGKNFTVAIELGSSPSLTITDGKTTVSLGEETVYVNGKALPRFAIESTAGAFRVSQEYGWVIVSGDMGVKVGCTHFRAFGAPDHLCAIQLSGFYHGKVEGVLGVFDNELKNEYRLPSDQITSNIDVLLKSWKLNKDCPAKTISKSLSGSRSQDFSENKLDFDTFFSLSSRSPHRKLGEKDVDFGRLSSSSKFSSTGTTVVAGLSALLLISFIFGYLGF